MQNTTFQLKRYANSDTKSSIMTPVDELGGLLTGTGIFVIVSALK